MTKDSGGGEKTATFSVCGLAGGAETQAFLAGEEVVNLQKLPITVTVSLPELSHAIDELRATLSKLQPQVITISPEPSPAAEVTVHVPDLPAPSVNFSPQIFTPSQVAELKFINSRLLLVLIISLTSASLLNCALLCLHFWLR